MVNLRYNNFLTTPDGKNCILYEITNENYHVINKFAEAKDYKNFYKCLDELIKESVPDFDNFSLIDKIFIYLAYCFYSIHASVQLSNGEITGSEVSLSSMLQNIEDDYKYKTVEYDIEGIKIVCSTPRKFVINGEYFNIEYSSAIDSINGIELTTNEQREEFMKKIGVKYSIKLEQAIKRDFNVLCSLFKVNVGVFDLHEEKVNILSGDMFRSLINVYREPLDDFYKVLYYCVQHMRMSYDTYMRMTPRETRHLFNQFIEEKQKEAEEHEKHSRMH